MGQPDWFDVATPSVQLRALTWDPPAGPIALCLHGFPDTAYGWRKVAPLPADAGLWVVAPFMRGYAPSSTAKDGSYHIGSLMDDALRVLDAAGPTGHDVVNRPRLGGDLGHRAGSDAGRSAREGRDHVRAARRGVSAAESGSRARPAGCPATTPISSQLVHHVLPIAMAARDFRVPRGAASLAAVVTGIRRSRGCPARGGRHRRPRELARGDQPVRSTVRGSRPPAEYAELHQWWMEPLGLPTLYLHGDDDGCAAPDYIPWVERVLPEGSDAFVVEGAGHFLQLEQPEVVARHIVDFIGRA